MLHQSGSGSVLGPEVLGQLHQRLPLCSGELAERQDTVSERDTSVHHRNGAEQGVGGQRQDALHLHTHGLTRDESATRQLAIESYEAAS